MVCIYSYYLTVYHPNFIFYSLIIDCAEFCPLSRFQELTKEYEIENILKECDLEDGNYNEMYKSVLY
jgi:hypothetical protein